jgi:hypothetical protein
MKMYILLFLLMFMLPIAYAEKNDTIPIIAEFKINSIYTDSDAKISVLSPEGVAILSSQSMNEISKGVFNYDFPCNSTTGAYKATVIFYNKTTAADLGSDSTNFNCVNTNSWEIGSCPTSDLGIITFWIFIFFMLILAFVGIAFNYSALVVFSGIVMFIMPFISGFCYEFVSYVILMLGLVFIGVGFNIRS